MKNLFKICLVLFLATVLSATMVPLASPAQAEELFTFPGGGGGGSRWDRTPPVVTITEPSDGETVNGIITVSLTASDNVGVTGTWARIDTGAWVAGSIFSWDTTLETDGSHTIEAMASDAAGNLGYDLISVTVDNGPPTPDTTPPIVTITSPLAGSTVGGSVTIAVTATDNVGVTEVAISIDGGSWIVGSTYSWDTTLETDGPHTIDAMASDAAGNIGYDSIDVTVDNTVPPPPQGEKIAVFFWASDAGAQWVIDRYIGILQAEGYTKFFDFCDTLNFAADFDTVDAYEDADDTIFFYLFGHGNYDGIDSYTLFRPYASVVYSSQFRTMMDQLETTRRGFLIESCHSGGWPEDFQAAPYLAMSTSSTTLLAYAVGSLPNEGAFSRYFWNYVEAGYDAIESFYYADTFVDGYPYPNQDPQITDYSTYIFFDN